MQRAETRPMRSYPGGMASTVPTRSALVSGGSLEPVYEAPGRGAAQAASRNDNEAQTQCRISDRTSSLERKKKARQERPAALSHLLQRLRCRPEPIRANAGAQPLPPAPALPASPPAPPSGGVPAAPPSGGV